MAGGCYLVLRDDVMWGLVLGHLVVKPPGRPSGHHSNSPSLSITPASFCFWHCYGTVPDSVWVQLHSVGPGPPGAKLVLKPAMLSPDMPRLGEFGVIPSDAHDLPCIQGSGRGYSWQFSEDHLGSLPGIEVGSAMCKALPTVLSLQSQSSSL